MIEIDKLYNFVCQKITDNTIVVSYVIDLLNTPSYMVSPFIEGWFWSTKTRDLINYTFDVLIANYLLNAISNFDKCNGTVYDIIRNHFENSVSEEENYMNYSELRIYPNNISISQISNILENYMNGVKEIIFINDENAFDVFLKNLTDIFKKRKICNYKGNIILNYDGDPKINVVEGKLSLFNFEWEYQR